MMIIIITIIVTSVPLPDVLARLRPYVAGWGDVHFNGLPFIADLANPQGLRSDALANVPDIVVILFFVILPPFISERIDPENCAILSNINADFEPIWRIALHVHFDKKGKPLNAWAVRPHKQMYLHTSHEVAQMYVYHFL